MSKKKATKHRNNKLKAGDIVAIPLGNGQFVFGRIYENFGLGIYDYISVSSLPPAELNSYTFAMHCSYFTRVQRDGNWMVVGHIAFRPDENRLGPPRWHQDVISGRYEIRQGEASRPATKKEIKGLSEDKMYFNVGLLQELHRIFGVE